MIELQVLKGSNDLTTRDKVFVLEAEMRKHPQLELPTKHYFSPGVYAREILIPKGTLLTGEIHKYAQLNILSHGEISVLTETGVQHVKAPFTVVSPPGTKRIAYAHTDCVWTTILHTFETDIEAIWHHFIAKDENDWLEFSNKHQLELGLN